MVESKAREEREGSEELEMMTAKKINQMLVFGQGKAAGAAAATGSRVVKNAGKPNNPGKAAQMPRMSVNKQFQALSGGLEGVLQKGLQEVLEEVYARVRAELQLRDEQIQAQNTQYRTKIAELEAKVQ